MKQEKTHTSDLFLVAVLWLMAMALLFLVIEKFRLVLH